VFKDHSFHLLKKYLLIAPKPFVDKTYRPSNNILVDAYAPSGGALFSPNKVNLFFRKSSSICQNHFIYLKKFNQKKSPLTIILEHYLP
jgi:hypothetical protein